MASARRSDDELLTIDEIAREFGFGRNHIRRLVAEGSIPSLLIGHRKRKVPRWVIRDWIRSNLSSSVTSSANITPN